MQNLTLTTGVDTIVGTANNDTITAVVDATPVTGVSTLNTGDTINGGAGVDSLNITYSGTTANRVVDLTGVENVNLRALVDTIQNTATWDGVKTITSDRSTGTVTLQNVGSASTTFALNKVAGSAIASGTTELTVGMAATAVAGTSDKLVLSLTDSGAAQLTAATEIAVATNSYAHIAANGFEALSVASNGTANAIEVSGIGAAIKSVEVSGNASLEIAGLNVSALQSISSTNTAGLTLNAGASALNIVANASAGKNTLTTGSGADSITTGAGDDTINAGTGNDIVNAGAGNDTITVGAGSVTVDAGDGNDVVLVTGLDKTDKLVGGAGTDTLGLSNADAAAAGAATTAGADLRAAYSGFEQLRVTDTLATAINAGKLGFNYVQLNAGVDDGGVGTTVGISGLTSGATIEVRSTTNFVDTVAVGINDAATTTDDVLNLKLNADLLVATNNVQTKFDIQGINNVNIAANDRVNFAGDDAQTLDANKDNGPDDGYTVSLTNAANLNNVNISGSSKVTYAVDASSAALKVIDATASTGNLDINASAFAGTERLAIKGSQGSNVIVGSNTTFGDAISGGAKADQITGGAGADSLTGGGGRDVFHFAATDSGTTASTIDKITDFGKVSTAVLASDVTAMGTVLAFQAATTGKGGADADLLNLSGTPVLNTAASSVSTGVIAALQAVDASNHEFDSATVAYSLSAKGVLTVGGADAAKVDTVAEWTALPKLAAGATADAVVAFELGGSTYVFEHDAAGDNMVQLVGVTGVTGMVVAGGGVAAAAGDIFVG